MTNPQPWWLTWPVAEVAAAMLPLFSSRPFSPHLNRRQAIRDVVAWCTTGTPHGQGQPAHVRPYDDPNSRAVAEAMQVLEHADLLMTDFESVGLSVEIGLTRLGMHALQTNTVRQHLGLSDAPANPTTS
jgi:hypothetical protein